MNHGLINNLYYKKREKNSNLLVMYPMLQVFKEYFARHKSRDKHYIAMKYHAIKQIKQTVPDATWQFIGSIMNMHHATVIYYASDKYQTLPGHNDFIKNNFDNYVKSFIYPISTRAFSADTAREHGEYIARHIPERKIA